MQEEFLGCDVSRIRLFLPPNPQKKDIDQLFTNLEISLLDAELKAKNIQFIIFANDSTSVPHVYALKKLKKLISEKRKIMKEFVDVACIVTNSKVITKITNAILKLVKTPARTRLVNSHDAAIAICNDLLGISLLTPINQI